MGTKAKDFGSNDRVPQAEGSQASGPWGAVRAPREKGRAGFGLPSSSSVRLRMWGQRTTPPASRVGAARYQVRVCAAAPRETDPTMRRLCWCAWGWSSTPLGCLAGSLSSVGSV